ncbi:hypothetical protein IGI04_001220 [Brassica rapa subsp. trilocularis]|uniref:AT-hook motif nuclear-localized protein n=1 Tax=Brassica rapa subsp. trilocularis TaxID=1813537 RepID=A0ABQ7NS99_BRACM|nr:hypothetical protein IGI04_001220 [Brassica rapa subsp. trilocularis]
MARRTREAMADGGRSRKKRSNSGISMKKRSSGGGTKTKRSYGGGMETKRSTCGGLSNKRSSGGGSTKKRSYGGGLSPEMPPKSKLFHNFIMSFPKVESDEATQVYAGDPLITMGLPALSPVLHSSCPRGPQICGLTK